MLVFDLWHLYIYIYIVVLKIQPNNRPKRRISQGPLDRGSRVERTPPILLSHLLGGQREYVWLCRDGGLFGRVPKVEFAKRMF